jgi:rubredoxin
MDRKTRASQAPAIMCPQCGLRYERQAYCPVCGHDPSGFDTLTPVGGARMEGTFIANLIRIVLNKVRARRPQDRRQ